MIEAQIKTDSDFVILSISDVRMTKNISNFIYLELANDIEKMIVDGSLKIGDKMKSVRILSKEMGVSVSTAFRAYYHLEDKGLIEARPKSGYYVKFSPKNVQKICSETPSIVFEKPIKIDHIIHQVLSSIPDEDIMWFSLNTPDLKLLPLAKLKKTIHEAINNRKDQGVNYEYIQGNQNLRKQIAKYSFNSKVSVSENDVVVTAGCLEALYYCLLSVTKPGDKIAIQTPSSFGLYKTLKLLELEIVEIPTSHEHGIDLRQLEKAITVEKVKACLLVPNFNTPSGTLFPEENKKEIYELIKKYKIPLIEDDVYGELYFGKQRPRTIKSYDDSGLVLLCSSVSKILAPGYRIGWTIPGKYKNRVIRMKQSRAFSTTTITQEAIGLFLEKGRFDLHMRHLRKALHVQYLKYLQAVYRYFPKSVSVAESHGGLTMWIKLDADVDSVELFQKAIQKGISISPGQAYSQSTDFHNYLSINYGRVFDKEVEKAIKTLGNLAKELKK